MATLSQNGNSHDASEDFAGAALDLDSIGTVPQL